MLRNYHILRLYLGNIPRLFDLEPADEREDKGRFGWDSKHGRHVRLYFRTYTAPLLLDSTYQIAIWSVMETGLAIIAGSLITLRPLFRWFLDGSASYNTNERRGKYPLSSLTGNTSKTAASRDPRYWRPDIPSDDTSTFVVTAVSSPDRLHADDNSSQEVLYPVPDPWLPPNSVNVHKTFRVGEEEA
ncbi:hypothetical protein APSETT445_009025 [Aspergillus pseudonomiae]